MMLLICHYILPVICGYYSVRMKHMDFSPCCGAKTQKESKTVFACSKCSTKHYLNPKGAMAVVLRRGSKYMFGLRKHEPSKGKLDCIGGFLDYGENFEEALRREVEEETGLKPADISAPRYIGSLFNIYPWARSEVPVVSNYYIADLVTATEPVAGDDIASIEFLEFSEVNPEDCAWEGMYEMVKKASLLG